MLHQPAPHFLESLWISSWGAGQSDFKQIRAVLLHEEFILDGTVRGSNGVATNGVVPSQMLPHAVAPDGFAHAFSHEQLPSYSITTDAVLASV